MTTLVSSTNLVFINGRRYRPGEPFELPVGATLAPGMTRLTPSEKEVSRSKTAAPNRAAKSDKTIGSKLRKQKRAPDQGA